MIRFGHSIVHAAVWLAIPALVIASVWVPVIQHYQVPDPHLTPEVIVRARSIPPQALLEDLRGERLLLLGLDGNEMIEAAEDLFRGRLQLLGQPPVSFRLSFRADDLAAGTAVTRLYVAGLAPADLLLQAYESTGDERFFSAARAWIADFARYEQQALRPRGLLWNDHAAANRVFVLSDFWRTYRGRPDFDVRTARTVLTLAGRSAELLAAPHQFTFATNHGVMQNIGLLRFGLAFPTLPRSEFYRRLAMERLGDQLAYYVSDNGVVLEHSAGYQPFGVALLDLAVRYAGLLDLDIPQSWKEKLARAERFMAQLPRPDGTLPMYGDTGPSAGWERYLPGRPRPLGMRPTESVTWDPVAGYAIWWDGLESWPEARRIRQTVVTFSYFPGHAHKHADELSVLLWAGGQTWWTDVGYWPFDRPERDQAKSWNGSSAPHLADEPAESRRTPRALFHGSSPGAVMVDAAREGPGGYRVRRQVVHVRPDVWLVVDAVSGAPGRASVTRWTAGPGVQVQTGPTDNLFVLSTGKSRARLVAGYAGSPGTTVRLLPKTLGPFMGYRTGAGEGDVSAVEVTQPGEDSWAAVAWLFDEAGTAAPTVAPAMKVWHGSEAWQAIVPGAGGTALEIARNGNRVSIAGARGVSAVVALEESDASARREEIIGALRRTAAKYPRTPLRLRYREWATYTLVGVLLVQEGFLLAVARRGLAGRLRPLTLPLWVLGGILVALVLGW
ncbi:MAG: heparinase II/III family protein [Armatimonadota bacterium]|nr:heparinase II/III family protein [Armatimonadota bacterium]